MTVTKNEMTAKIDNYVWTSLTMKQWRDELREHVDVYIYETSFLAKRFDAIHFEICSVSEALQILKDNLYCLLRYNYFKKQTDKIDMLISKIVASFCENIKTTLRKITFSTTGSKVYTKFKHIPHSAVAFRNGVYDFLNNSWLFKIEPKVLDDNQNIWYEYNKQYIILWYVDIIFTPLEGLDVTKLNGNELRKMLHPTKPDKSDTILGYNLVYNMSFNHDNIFSPDKFQHLCEILGFTLNTQFIQNFVIFIGAGSNGKNSLLDGCFSHHVIPKPISVSLDSIEEDKFITGAMENRYHNFFLETSNKTYNKAEVLKQLTGSTLQTIEKKGENRRTTFLNLKHIFSGNGRESLKFGDSTIGFIRRVNLYEVFYQWDSYGDYLKIGNYLPTAISPDLNELINDYDNPMMYIYLGMWGIAKATKNFTQPFTFNFNEYGTKYEAINSDVRRFITNIKISDLIKILIKNTDEDTESLIYIDKVRFYQHPDFNKFFNLNKNTWQECLNNEELLVTFLEDKNVFINLKVLKQQYKEPISTQQFNKEVVKYAKNILRSDIYHKHQYISVRIIGRKIIFKNKLGKG